MSQAAPRRGFENKEFKERLDKVHKVITENNLDGILFSSEPEIRYFTGFFTQFWQSPTRPWFIFIPVDKRPVAIIPSIGQRLMRDCFIEEIYTWSSPAGDYDGIQLLSEIISKYSKSTHNVGLMMGRETNFRAPLNDINKMFVNLRETAKFVDVTKNIQHLKMIKSSAEIEKIRHICGITSDVFESVPNWISADMPLSQVFRQFKIQALSAGVDDVSYLVGAAGSGGYYDIIAPPNDRPIRDGDILMLDTGCIWDGYFCDFDRNFRFGKVNDEAESAHRTLIESIEKVAKSIQPGRTKSKDLFETMNCILRPDMNDSSAMAEENVGRYGHGLGMQLTEPPSHTNWDQTIIEAGMVLTLEPSINYGKENFLMVAEENILVTESGVEFLSKPVGKELPHIPVGH
ncbi:MAG: Xaa-Pro peptidase family protein [Pseudomonadota bacterium]|nr:Xaa-Pro peptidase family protein [Pseudomonadota bacterium]